MRDSNSVRAIVLAGTHMWGESAFDGAAPRAMLPIVDAPAICHVLRWLRASGIEDVTVCANGDSRAVRDYLGTGAGLGVRLAYFEDRIPRGPAGCARDATLDDSATAFVIAEACAFPQVQLPRLLAAHAAAGAAMTLVVERPPGDAVMHGESLQPAGCYVFDRRALAEVSSTGFQDIKEMLIPQLRRAGARVAVHISDQPTPRVTNADTYLAVNAWMLERLVQCGSGIPHYRSFGELRAHARATIDPAAQFIGPVLVGPGSRVARSATIVGPTVIGANCAVSDHALVCRSILWDDVTVGERARVDRSVLTNGALVEPRESLTNSLRLAVGDGRATLLRRLVRRWVGGPHARHAG